MIIKLSVKNNDILYFLESHRQLNFITTKTDLVEMVIWTFSHEG